jgi:hypothetical protein
MMAAGKTGAEARPQMRVAPLLRHIFPIQYNDILQRSCLVRGALLTQ